MDIEKQYIVEEGPNLPRKEDRERILKIIYQDNKNSIQELNHGCFIDLNKLNDNTIKIIYDEIYRIRG